MVRRIFDRFQLAIVLAVLSTFMLAGPPARTAEAQTRRCFAETGQCIEGRFREYWEQNGGLPVFGYPVTAAAEELNFDLGRSFLTQWFERGRLELHPENTRPYDVLLGRLGADQLRKMGVDWQSEPRGTGAQPGCLWFAETQHNVCNQAAGAGFQAYWQGHGLEFDGRPGTSYEESLALFGQAVTEPRVETNSSGDTVLTQWFERARFEWHPQNPAEFRVLLGLLGNEARVPLVRARNPGLPGRLLVSAGALYTVRADGSQVTRLRAEDGMNGGFVISPDGRKVATHCSQGGGSGLCTVDFDGRNLTRINDDPNASPSSWSPDGTRIAYVSGSDSRRGLRVINADGSGDRLLMAGTPGLMQNNAEWSPDGTRIAFNTVFSEHAIYVVNADGTGLRRLVTQAGLPRWSPNGSQIVFESESRGNLDVYVINPDGSGLTRLTNSADAESAPAWSPNGAYIAYRWAGAGPPSPQGNPTGIVVMRADGSNPTEVLRSEPTYSFNRFAWSPDGNYVAASRACPRLCGPEQILGTTRDGSRRFTLVEAERAGGPASLVAWLPE